MPIKRSEYLKPLSRDHHHGLLLCWKIRTGLKREVDIQRIKAYTDWFFKTSLLPHFNAEEQYFFPLLGNEHEMIKKALSAHRRLTRLFECKTDLEKTLNQIEEELENHIRFEERILFNEIQNTASEKEMQGVQKSHIEHPIDETWEDKFWI
jgi:iron-sulfur cluster repair protein YtfE (RIC family)